MELLKVLAMPLQFTSLVFVAGSSLMLGVIVGSSNFATFLIGLLWLWISATWLTAYAFRMIDDAANGVRRTAVADVDMINPFSDARVWVHPIVGLALFVAHLRRPDIPVAPALLAVALVFPPSIAASAMSGHARDALNPLAIVRVIRGLGPWYFLMVLATALCAALGVQLVRRLDPEWLLFAALELLLLVGYAGIGGLVHLRRTELGFTPRFSPERQEEKLERERALRRQQVFDELFEQVRGRHDDRALATATQWLQSAQPHQRHAELQALIATGARWRDAREFARLLRSLLPLLLAWRQPQLAMQLADAGLAAAPGFAPAEEATAIALIDFAVQSGRRRAAARLLANYLESQPAADIARLDSLRTRWTALT